jgi:hypothetical protein
MDLRHRLSRNFGRMTVGLNAATSDAVILMDADLQHRLHWSIVPRWLAGTRL